MIKMNRSTAKAGVRAIRKIMKKSKTKRGMQPCQLLTVQLERKCYVKRFCFNVKKGVRCV